jgi:hypothetical protein
MAFGFGGSKQKSSSSSNSAFDQNVWGPQADAFPGMYGAAGNLYNTMMPYANLGFGMMPQMQGMMTNAYNMGNTGANSLIGGGSYGDTSGMRDNLFASLSQSMNSPSNVGRMYEDIIGGKGNTYIDPMVDSMKSGVMDNLKRMQANNGLSAVAMGQSGSSRHAMENAMLGKEANKDMMNMENIMRGGAYDTDLNWKMKIAEQADLGRSQAQDRALSALGNRDQNVIAGMNFAPMMQNLGMGYMAPWMQAMQMPWLNMNNYAGALGDPTVLSSGNSSSSSQGKGTGFSFSM